MLFIVSHRKHHHSGRYRMVFVLASEACCPSRTPSGTLGLPKGTLGVPGWVSSNNRQALQPEILKPGGWGATSLSGVCSPRPTLPRATPQTHVPTQPKQLASLA